MVTADIEKSTDSISQAFRKRDLTTIALTGALASVGLVVAASVGAAFSGFALPGSPTQSRLGLALIGVGAAVVGYAGVEHVGGAVGGGLALGSLVVVGLSVIGAVAGPMPVLDDARFRGLVADADAGLPDASLSAVTGKMTGCSTCGQDRAPTGQPRTVGHSPVATGYR